MDRGRRAVVAFVLLLLFCVLCVSCDGQRRQAGQAASQSESAGPESRAASMIKSRFGPGVIPGRTGGVYPV